MQSEPLTLDLSRFCPEGQAPGRDKGRLLSLSRVPRVLKGRGTGQQAVPSAFLVRDVCLPEIGRARSHAPEHSPFNPYTTGLLARARVYKMKS